MHQGVRSLVYWIDKHRDGDGIRLRPPATAADISGLEQQLGMPIPVDLKIVLTRFNGGQLPSGELLPAGTGPGTIDGELRALAKRLDRDLLDPDLLLPFMRGDDGTLLAFDRAAGPLPDTWPIVDFFADTGDTRLVYRTFDSFCRVMVAKWESPDFQTEFNVDRYLREGKLHAQVEPDVASAHATVAHAERRLGHPEDALASYMRASRCLPALPWVDWEALKLAALLGRADDAMEAARRLCARAPATRWRQRETTPRYVADVIGRVGARDKAPDAWLALLDQLAEQARGEDRAHILKVRAAIVAKGPLPTTTAPPGSGAVPVADSPAKWWENAKLAFLQGAFRDEHMLLDPSVRALGEPEKFVDLLRLRRDF